MTRTTGNTQDDMGTTSMALAAVTLTAALVAAIGTSLAALALSGSDGASSNWEDDYISDTF